MNAEHSNDLLASRHGRLVVSAIIVAVFVSLRLALDRGRELFYDELFTAWIASKPLVGILGALRHDSGPPLYYFVCHLTGAPRTVSLVCAGGALVALLASTRLGPERFTAAALLAVFPPAVLFAVDGRAYSMCALFVAIGVIALVDRREDASSSGDADQREAALAPGSFRFPRWGGGRCNPYVAALSFVLAACCHYYGVLFFPLLVRRPRALLLASLAFLPAFLLALRQPPEAMAWLGRVEFPAALFALPPGWLLVAAAVLLVLALCRRPPSFALMTLVPLCGAVLLFIAGRPVYFPLRFESVLAGPFVLWLAFALEAWKPALRRPLTGALLLVALAITGVGIVEHIRRPLDPYRTAARFLAQLDPTQTIVATGYLYLESERQLGERVSAFPREQAIHPGWRALTDRADLQRETATLPQEFVWIGERAAPELAVLRGRYEARPLFANGAAMIARMRRRP